MKTCFEIVLAAALLAAPATETTSAPAPLPRKPAAGQRRPDCPASMLGIQTQTWFGTTYVYDFHADGTFTHLRRYGQSECSGTWRLDFGVLTVKEPSMTSLMRQDGPGGCWKDTLRKHVYLAREMVRED